MGGILMAALCCKGISNGRFHRRSENSKEGRSGFQMTDSSEQWRVNNAFRQGYCMHTGRQSIYLLLSSSIDSIVASHAADFIKILCFEEKTHNLANESEFSLSQIQRNEVRKPLKQSQYNIAVNKPELSVYLPIEKYDRQRS
jgi:hypothetical protein